MRCMWYGWKLWATALVVFALLHFVYYGLMHPELRGTRRGMLAIEDAESWLFIAFISITILALIIIAAWLSIFG